MAIEQLLKWKCICRLGNRDMCGWIKGSKLTHKFGALGVPQIMCAVKPGYGIWIFCFSIWERILSRKKICSHSYISYITFAGIWRIDE